MMMKLNEISIEITQQCPNHCIHCSSYSTWHTKMIMPWLKLREVIDDAVTLGAKTICLSGGEPFLHPDIVDIVNYIREKDCSCFIYSSGIIYDGITHNALKTEVLEAISKSVTKIILNYEAADSQTYNQIMGTNFGGYDILKQSIVRCVKAGIRVETHVVPMKINYKQIRDIISQCDKLGVEQVSFLRIVMHGRALENTESIILTESEVNSFKDLVQKIREKGSVKVRLGIPFSDCSTRINCLTGTKKLNIRYDGKVYPCEAFKNDLPTGFSKYEPDSIYNKRLIDIYRYSDYLADIRQRLEAFQQVNCCENCMNQYYRNRV